MKICIVTDAWRPQVNGVVTTLVELQLQLEQRGHQVDVIEPGAFQTRPCPGYVGIDLAIRPYAQVARTLDGLQPDAIHIATEGPLGWAARRYCLRAGLAFTTAFHTKFPEIVNAAVKVPVGLGYAVMRHFHRPSSGVMVPTASVLRMLEKRGFRNLRQWTHGVDTTLFPFRPEPRLLPGIDGLNRPVMLFVGRVSYEKNIKAFLDMDVPGTKIVCGVGPVLADLKAQYPKTHWLGVLPRADLADVYAAADVFVFPSHADTFGLVMLEAMSCGTPVAAFPSDGPLEVLGRRHPDGRSVGGAMHRDLDAACRAALQVSRTEARARALDFSWSAAAASFEQHLVSARSGTALPGRIASLSDVTKLSPNL